MKTERAQGAAGPSKAAATSKVAPLVPMKAERAQGAAGASKVETSKVAPPVPIKTEQAQEAAEARKAAETTSKVAAAANVTKGQGQRASPVPCGPAARADQG